MKPLSISFQGQAWKSSCRLPENSLVCPCAVSRRDGLFRMVETFSGVGTSFQKQRPATMTKGGETQSSSFDKRPGLTAEETSSPPRSEVVLLRRSSPPYYCMGILCSRTHSSKVVQGVKSLFLSITQHDFRSLHVI